MKAIIFLVSRSRFVVPRVGNFLYAQDLAAVTYPHQPFVYQGRALDMAEFNEAAARLLDTRNPALGYEVSVRLVEASEAAPAPEAIVTEPTVEIVTEPEVIVTEPEPLAEANDEGEESAPKPAKKRASKARATSETEID
jgi:hypothetical protein